MCFTHAGRPLSPDSDTQVQTQPSAPRRESSQPLVASDERNTEPLSKSVSYITDTAPNSRYQSFSAVDYLGSGSTPKGKLDDNVFSVLVSICCGKSHYAPPCIIFLIHPLSSIAGRMRLLLHTLADHCHFSVLIR